MANLFTNISKKIRQSNLLKKAQKLIEIGAEEKAVDILERILSENPEKQEALLWLAIAKSGKKDYEGALASIDKALLLDSKHLFSKVIKGETLLFMERYDESLQYLTEALEANPDNTKVSYLAGLAYLRKGDIEKASSFFEDVLKYDRELVDSRLLTMAELYLHRNK